MSKSIDAYSDRERVRRYDADMDVLHPNRHKMVDIALEILPFQPDDALSALDLGIGTGYFTSRFLNTFPRAQIIGLDGSGAMITLARSRLDNVQDKVTFMTCSFEDITDSEIKGDSLDLIFSAYALHHLDVATKRQVLQSVVSKLKPGGWLLNADLVSNPDPEIERTIQSARVRGIVARSAGTDSRFVDEKTVRAFLDGLEESEGDQPLSAPEDVELMTQCGIANATVLWQEYREIVCGGTRSG